MTMTYTYAHYLKNAAQDSTAYHHVYDLFPNEDCAKAFKAISQWPEYAATPLIQLTDIAQAAGVQKIYYKDESGRFGLGSFKALGGSYAIQQLAERSTDQALIVCTATDGNHGRSVAWGAQLSGVECHIFIHAKVSQSRATAMADMGAVIHRVDGNYDDSIAACIEMADNHNWQIVSDTSWEGYQEVPRQIMAGYSVMTQEIITQLGEDKPTHIILQAGCGGMAGAIIGSMWDYWKEDMPTVIIVEADMADCVYQSLKQDKLHLVKITEETMMAGLSCGEVSELAWPLLKYGAAHVMTINDRGVAPMMRWLARPSHAGRSSIIGGECAASGLIALMALKNDPKLAKDIGITKAAKVLVLGTEGSTDPDIYAKVMAGDL